MTIVSVVEGKTDNDNGKSRSPSGMTNQKSKDHGKGNDNSKRNDNSKGKGNSRSLRDDNKKATTTPDNEATASAIVNDLICLVGRALVPAQC